MNEPSHTGRLEPTLAGSEQTGSAFGLSHFVSPWVCFYLTPCFPVKNIHPITTHTHAHRFSLGLQGVCPLPVSPHQHPAGEIKVCRHPRFHCQHGRLPESSPRLAALGQVARCVSSVCLRTCSLRGASWLLSVSGKSRLAPRQLTVVLGVCCCCGSCWWGCVWGGGGEAGLHQAGSFCEVSALLLHFRGSHLRVLLRFRPVRPRR